MGFQRNLIRMKQFSDLLSSLHLIRGMWVLSMCICVSTDIHPFLWDILFIVVLLVSSCKKLLTLKIALQLIIY